jgi:hypothetical protein
MGMGMGQPLLAQQSPAPTTRQLHDAACALAWMPLRVWGRQEAKGH